MAKTRAQRKAEKRAREAELERQRTREGDGGSAEESSAQHDTQVPVSGDVAEFEASIDTQGVPPEDAPARAVEAPAEPTAPETPAPATPDAPAPSRADEPPAPPKPSRRERREQRRAEKQAAKEEERQKAQRRKQMEERTAAKDKEPKERQRGAVIGFLASCWAELQKVQWPDRDTLVQASAVTLVFVAVMAAYLGALDAAFNWLVKQVL